jgi:branched-chain amino acid aminotransferase
MTTREADMSERVIYVNGEFVPENQARISVLDHAVLYGDGVFETVVAWNGRVFKLEEHIDRFYRSMAAIAMEPPFTRDELKALVLEAVRRNGFSEAYVKWIATRGSNGTPLMDPAGCIANLIILVQPYIDRGGATGLRVKTTAIRRPPGHVLDAHIKSLNYLNLVLAKIEVKAAGADQALMLDVHGHVCESPGFNVFMVKDKKLHTPSNDILVGVTRDTVIELAPQLGYPVQEGVYELYHAHSADEIFLTSTAGGLLPVVELDGRRIGDGTPGPVFKALLEGYRAALSSDRWGTPL